MSSSDFSGEVNEPGLIVSIDPEHPGKLVPSALQYDKRVAGVISGADGVRPGMLMGQRGSVADGKHLVALPRSRAFHFAPAMRIRSSAFDGRPLSESEHSLVRLNGIAFLQEGGGFHHLLRELLDGIEAFAEEGV